MAGGVVFRSEFDDGVKVGVGFRVDIMYIEAATKTITGITVANPGVVTAVAHGHSNGDKVFIFSVAGMTEVNFSIQTVANKAADTFEIEDTSGFSAYTSGGTANTIAEMDSGSNPLGLQYNGQNSNKYGIDGVIGSIKKSIATFVLEQTIAGQFDNILAAEDDRFEIYVYKDTSGTHALSTFSATGNLYWSGNLIPENISEPYNTVVPYPITFIAKDGLERLKDIDFESSGTKIQGRQSVLTTLMFCLNLLDIKDNPKGAKLGLYEAVDIFEAGMDDAIDMSSLEQADIDPEIFRTDTDEAINCEDVVHALCLGFQFRLYQGKGKWNVERVNQLNGTMERRLFDTSSELVSSENAYDPIIVTGDATAKLLTKRMIRKSWKSAKATFNAGQVINLVPFGEFEVAAFANDTSFVSGGWTISGSATILKTEINQPGSEFAVNITSTSSGVGDYIESPAIKAPQDNIYRIKFKTRVNIADTPTVFTTLPNFWWMVRWQQDGGTQKYLRDNSFKRSIASITVANPGVVTTNIPHGLADGEQVVLAVLGMTELATISTVANKTDTTFEIEDTTGFSAFTTGDVSPWVWTTVSTTNSVTSELLNTWIDHNIGGFLIPDSGDAGDMFVRLYELDPGIWTLADNSGILYDRMIGTVNAGGSLPIEITKVTAEISSSGSSFRHDGFDLKFGDVAGFANQDFVLPVGSRLELELVIGQILAGDSIQFDIDTTARTFTTAQPKAITNITKANPAVVTSAAHGFSNGNVVLIWDVGGMTEINGGNQLGTTYTVANKTANNFELSGIDSQAFSTYTSGGNILLLSSDTFFDGKSLRWAIMNYAGTGYKVGYKLSADSLEDLVTVFSPTPDTSRDMGTVTLSLGNGSDMSKLSQTDAIEAEATVTSRPLSKGAVSVAGNVTQGWYEKGDAATDTDEGGTNVSHIKMILLGILRNYGVTTKKHTGTLADLAGDVHFGSIIHDATNDNGVYFSFNGASSNEKRLEWKGELIQHSNASPTLAYTTIERTVGEDINNQGQASPFIIGPTITETINQSIITSGISVVEGTLIAAQIKTLLTSPVTNVAAAGTDKTIVPSIILLRFNWNAVAFTNTLSLRYGAGGQDLGIINHTIIQGTADSWLIVQINRAVVTSSFPTNTDLVWRSGADSAAGDSTLDYSIIYHIANF